jgi:hypothetical protein
MRFSFPFTSISALALMTACGEQPTPVAGDVTETPSDEYRLISIVDSIGVELGDSNYVWGSIEVVTHTADGNILALDRPACCVREFTIEGEFVRQFGRKGTGPGEFVNPLSMVRFSDGRVGILDIGAGGLHTFMPDGTWEGISADITNEPPLWMTATEGNGYVCTLNDWNFVDDEFVVTARVARFEADGVEPTAVYWENSFPWDPQNLTALIRGSYFANTWASDREGHVFVAPRDSEDGTITGFTTEGEEIVSIEYELEPVPKTQLEIDEEAEFWNRRAESMGANGPFNYQPDPYRWMVHSMGIDRNGQLWVRRGTDETPTFDVFDMSGSHVFTAHAPSITGHRGLLWEIHVDEFGILGYSLDPEDGYQKLYILELNPVSDGGTG